MPASTGSITYTAVSILYLKYCLLINSLILVIIVKWEKRSFGNSCLLRIHLMLNSTVAFQDTHVMGIKILAKIPEWRPLATKHPRL